MIGYHINNHWFSHALHAFDHAARYSPHETVKFVFDDDFWSQQDWSREPLESMDELMDIRAHQIRNKYGYLILLFSGGTDSYQIYNVFRRNNIHIDEIAVAYGNTDTILDLGSPADVVSWLVTNHWDPTTKITPVAKTSTDLSELHQRHRQETSETFANQPFLCLNSADTWMLERMLEQHQGRKPCIVTGVEKPLLVFQSSNWYVSHMDKVYRIHLPKLEQMEWFYISRDLPELHIKQCYILLKAAKTLKPATADHWTTADWASKDYQNYAYGCGRLGELFPGASELNKKLTSNMAQHMSTSESELSRIIDELSPGFLRELRSRRLPSDVRLYMQRQGLYNNTETDWHGIYSNFIRIGQSA